MCRQLLARPGPLDEAGPQIARVSRRQDPEWVTVACVTPWPFLAIRSRAVAHPAAARRMRGKGVVANES